MTQIVAEVVDDPTLPRTEEHPCPKCKHREAVFFQSQSNRAEVSKVICEKEEIMFWCVYFHEVNRSESVYITIIKNWIISHQLFSKRNASWDYLNFSMYQCTNFF